MCTFLLLRHFVQDILLSADTPIFATSNDDMKLIKNGIIVERTDGSSMESFSLLLHFSKQ